jgi:hypothetical protein
MSRASAGGGATGRERRKHRAELSGLSQPLAWGRLRIVRTKLRPRLIRAENGPRLSPRREPRERGREDPSAAAALAQPGDLLGEVEEGVRA